MKSDHQQLIKAWLNKVEKDLITVEHEFPFDEPVYETICFHCQQAVEKILKGYLIFIGTGYRKTHEIGELISIREEKDRGISFLKEDADKLTDYAIEIRYPDMDIELSESDAREAYDIAKRVILYVRGKITQGL